MSGRKLFYWIVPLLMLSWQSMAQAPQKMTFQSVIRNSSGALVVSSVVGMQISILQDSATGPAVYVERQYPTTNANGLASILIGTGTVVSGSFSSIVWASGTYYLKVQADPLGDSSYSINATSQLVSVPYAFYASYAAQSGDSTGTGTRPTVASDSIVATSFTSATCYGDVTASGGQIIIFKGYCVDTIAMPTTDHSYVTPGSALGSYPVYVSGLLPNTIYHARAFATTVNGTSYGDTLTFTTLALATPTIVTDSITGVSNVSANGIGSVTGDGGSTVTARGICWNATGMPTTSDLTSPSGTGTGNFFTTLSLLSPSTTYYGRAYATNAMGTAYGSEVSFTTNDLSYAALSTDSITAILCGTAMSGVNVTSSGGSTIPAQGICWGLGPFPTTDSNTSYTATGLGDHPKSLTGLSPATTYYVRGFCTNGVGTAYGAQRTFTTLALSVPIVSTNPVVGITAVSATSGGNLSYDGGNAILSRGVCWSITDTPTVDSSHTTDGTSTGIYNSNMTGLSPATTYFVRAYATNAIGSAYGPVISFTTDSVDTALPTLPIVGTNIPAQNTSSTATGGGYVLSGGGLAVSAYGVCWSTSPLPTLSDSHTTDGSGLGYFSSTITGLSGCGASYYVRAYATNGLGTTYGNQQTLSSGSLPIILGDSVGSITDSSAISGGNITSDGGCPITRRGVIWVAAYDTSSLFLPAFPDSAACHYTNDGTGTGSYTSTITGLIYGATYHLRSYATNSIGTAYGPLQVFTVPVPSGHYIGQSYAGGIIFYLDSTGNHGLVCATQDFWTLQWGCQGTLISGTDTAFGSGEANTASIVAGCSEAGDAADSCVSYSGGGYGDWYLPSLAELRILTNNLLYNPLANLCLINWSGSQYVSNYSILCTQHWSSSEVDAGTVWYYNYYFPEQNSKSNNFSVRPIRKF